MSAQHKLQLQEQEASLGQDCVACADGVVAKPAPWISRTDTGYQCLSVQLMLATGSQDERAWVARGAEILTCCSAAVLVTKARLSLSLSL